MPIEVSECYSVSAKAADLGVQVGPCLTLLPFNFESASNSTELTQLASVSTIKKLAAEVGIDLVGVRPKDGRPKFVDNNSIDLLAPAIFVPALLLSQDPTALNVAINVVSSYVFEAFQGLGRSPRVKFEVICETTAKGSCKRISYEGDVAGLQGLDKAIKKVLDG